MKKLFIPLGVIGLIIFLGFIWNNYDIRLNSQYLLKKTYNKYIALFDVKACKEAYEFLSQDSKNNHPFSEFKDKCVSSQNGLSITEEIKNIVFINSGFAKIDVVAKATDGTDKYQKDYAITWVRQQGQWKRDWPN